MYRQLDKDNGMLAGYLAKDPEERRDKSGKRMIVLDVCYDATWTKQASGQWSTAISHMPVVVYGEYTSEARLLSKGDCIIAIGERPVAPPRGYTVNPMQVCKRNFGVLLHNGVSRAFEQEAALYEKNEVVKKISKGRKAKAEKRNDEDDDKGFQEIDGDLY